MVVGGEKMIDECLSVFQENLREEGESLILEDYIPADGTYIIVGTDGEVKVCRDIKFVKKTGELDRFFLGFQDICFYDYYSKLITMNKPQDSAKIIHSNNYFSFWIKKESLSNGKLTKEVIEKYYEVLEMPEKKYQKGKTKELYQTVKEQLGEVDKETLQKNKEWILEHIFNIQEVAKVDLEKKDYLKIFFEADYNEYEREGRRYFIPNIYNSNDYNVKVNDDMLGLPDNNLGMNSKKPFLAMKTRKIASPYLLNMDQVMLQKKFYDYLMNFASAGKYNVYVDLEHTKFQGCRNNEFPEGSICGFFLRLAKGKNEAEIHYQDIVPYYNVQLSKEFFYENIMEIYNEKFPDYEEQYRVYSQIPEVEALIDDIFFSKVLGNNYFTEVEKLKGIDPKLKQQLLTYRRPIFTWTHLGNQAGIASILDELALSAIKTSIINEYFGKAVRQINLKLSLQKYFYEGGEYMADFSVELRENLKEKMICEDSPKIESDREYYYGVGQLFRYYIFLNKSAKKNESLINPILNARNNEVLKKKLLDYYKKYNYAILLSKRADVLLKMLLGYEPEGKIMQDMICMGFVDNNLVLEKKEEK